MLGYNPISEQPISALAPASSGTAYTLTADAGSFALTGQDAEFLIGRILTADAGSFSLTGQDANLNIGRVLTADAGEFLLTGQDATLSVGRVLTADAGAFVLDGQDATLTVTTGGTAYTLTADAGEFLLDGQDAQFVIGTTATDTHDGFWHKEWLKLHKKKAPTIAEIVEAVRDNPVEAVAQARAMPELMAEYPTVSIEAVRQNVALQRFIARQILEIMQEDDDMEALLLL